MGKLRSALKRIEAITFNSFAPDYTKPISDVAKLVKVDHQLYALSKNGAVMTTASIGSKNMYLTDHTCTYVKGLRALGVIKKSEYDLHMRWQRLDTEQVRLRCRRRDFIAVAEDLGVVLSAKQLKALDKTIASAGAAMREVSALVEEANKIHDSLRAQKSDR